MIETAGLCDLLAGADLVVTGEGRYDAQSGMGKLTGRVMAAARRAGVPVLLVCGRVDGPLPDGVRAVDSGGRSLDESGITRLTRDACRDHAGGDRL
jgi:glycerate kinase